MLVTKEEIFNPIANKRQDLIELFVEFYGEKYRDKITRNLNNTEFFFLEPDVVDSIKKMYGKFANDIIQDFYRETGFKAGAVPHPDEIENYIAILKGRHYNTDFMAAMQLGSIMGSLDVNFKGGNLNRFLLNPINYFRVNKKLRNALKLWESKYTDSVDSIDKECKAMVTPLEEDDERLAQLSSDYDKKIAELYGAKIKSLLRHRQDVSFFEFMAVKSNIQTLYAIGEEGLRDEFLINEDTKQGLISMFQVFGFDHGDDYEAYLDDKKLMNAIFDEKFLDKLNELEKSKIVHTITNNPHFQAVYSRIKDMDLQGGDLEIVAVLFSYLTSSIMGGFNQPQFAKDGTLRPICVCPMGATLDDEVFIHEAGHAAQSEIVKPLEGGGYTVKSGIETLDYKIYKENFTVEEMIKNGSVSRSIEETTTLKEDNRKYKMLNEVIHDILTKKITKLAKQKGISFGHNSLEATTIYHTASDMLEQFVEDNLDFIKDCYMSSDPYIFVRALGQDNVDRLADAVSNVVCMSNNDRIIIRDELEDVDTIDMTKFDLAHDMGRYSPTTRQYLSQYLVAESVFKDFASRKQM